jgi:hypothetical protein
MHACSAQQCTHFLAGVFTNGLHSGCRLIPGEIKELKAQLPPADEEGKRPPTPVQDQIDALEKVWVQSAPGSALRQEFGLLTLLCLCAFASPYFFSLEKWVVQALQGRSWASSFNTSADERAISVPTTEGARMANVFDLQYFCYVHLYFQERKELTAGGNPKDKHFNWGSLLLGLGVTFSIGGGFNTYLRTGNQPHPALLFGFACGLQCWGE